MFNKRKLLSTSLLLAISVSFFTSTVEPVRADYYVGENLGKIEELEQAYISKQSNLTNIEINNIDYKFNGVEGLENAQLYTELGWNPFKKEEIRNESPIIYNWNQKKMKVVLDTKTLDNLRNDVQLKIDKLFPKQEYKKMGSREAFIRFYNAYVAGKMEYKMAKDPKEGQSLDYYIETNTMVCLQYSRFMKTAMNLMGYPSFTVTGYLNNAYNVGKDKDGNVIYLTVRHVIPAFYDTSSKKWTYADPTIEYINGIQFYTKLTSKDIYTSEEELENVGKFKLITEKDIKFSWSIERPLKDKQYTALKTMGYIK